MPVKGVQPDVEEETTTELDLTQENILNKEVQILNKPLDPTQKTDFAIKRKIREEQKESNVPLKKFMQDCNGKSNHFAKSETVQKETDLIRLDQGETIHEKFQCHFCPEKLAKGGEMSAHVTSVHAIKCQFCAAKFLTLNDMNDHITAVHEACSPSTYLEPKSKKSKT